LASALAGRRYASGFAAGDRGREGLLRERFFPFQLYHRLTPTADGLGWLLVEWRLLGILAAALDIPYRQLLRKPTASACSSMCASIAGPVIHYRGWLVQKSNRHVRGARR
jgi:hypothetical protein